MGLISLFNKKTQDREFDPQNIVGKKCTVIETVDNNAGCGQVKVNGQIWAARSAYEDISFEAGEILRIVAVEGVRLVCVKY